MGAEESHRKETGAGRENVSSWGIRLEEVRRGCIDFIENMRR